MNTPQSETTPKAQVGLPATNSQTFAAEIQKPETRRFVMKWDSRVDWLERWLQYLQEPIDGASLAVFRMCFGLSMLVHCWHLAPMITYKYVLPKLNFPLIDGLHTLPGAGMFALFGVMAFSAACVTLGLRYRLAACVLFATYTYSFLLDQSYYQNHYYLMGLLSFLFCFLPAGRVWSLDNGLKFSTTPRWPLMLLKAQIFIVYFFGGIAKMNSDWLIRQEPMTTFLPTQVHNAALAHIVSQHWFGNLLAWGGISLDFSIGFLLWWQPTFWLGALLAFAFHVLNANLFHIGIFPWLMIATIPLFAAPDWPRRALARLSFVGEKLSVQPEEQPYVSWARKARLGASVVDDADKPASEPDRSVSTDELESKKIERNRTLSYFTIALMHVYLIGQILIPLRHFLYPGNNESWTERGHLFSWHMMLRRKQVKYFDIKATDPSTGATINLAHLDHVINGEQTTVMRTHPRMILRLVHYIADGYMRKTGVRPRINVVAVESLNVRPARFLIDPRVDLASVTNSDPPTWILPLDKPQIRPVEISTPQPDGKAPDQQTSPSTSWQE